MKITNKALISLGVLISPAVLITVFKLGYDLYYWFGGSILKLEDPTISAFPGALLTAVSIAGVASIFIED